MENKMSDEGDKRTDKRKQHCTACRNHDQKQPKTSHKCPYDHCECLLCQLTQTSRLIMRHQQRLWRHLKDKNPVNEQHSKKQVCDKCRNHGIMVSKRNHKGSCALESCKCELCGLTNNRRDIMRHQQRVRRSATVTAVEEEDAYEYVQKTKTDLIQKFGDLDGRSEECPDGYSSPEERDDTPSSPEEIRSLGQDGTKKQFIERYRKDEIASQVPWEDDRKPHLSYQLQPEYSSLQPQASSSNWYDNIAAEGATSKKLLSQHVKQEIIYPLDPVSSETPHDPPGPSLQHGHNGLSPQHGRHIFNPVAKRTRYGVPADDYQLSQSLPSYQLAPRIIPNILSNGPRIIPNGLSNGPRIIPNGLSNGIMCSLPRTQIGPNVASYPLNLLQSRPFMLNYTHPFNKTPHPMIRPPFHPH